MLMTDSLVKASRPLLEIEGLEQRLKDKERHEEFVVEVGQRISIYPGNFVALFGPSGCGKTTLLSVLGLLRAPTNPSTLARFSICVEEAGHVTDVDLKAAWLSRRERQIEGLRRKWIGFALQSGELLPALTVRENISAPLRLNGITGAQCRERVDGLISAFGLRKVDDEETDTDSMHERSNVNGRGFDMGNARINKLSGGEYQRVSLARAIAHHPRLIFVDEPTAALNREMARGALEKLRELLEHESRPAATVMITHDEALAQEFANMTIRMAPIRNRPAGRVVEVIQHKSSLVDSQSLSAGLSGSVSCDIR